MRTTFPGGGVQTVTQADPMAGAPGINGGLDENMQFFRDLAMRTIADKERRAMLQEQLLRQQMADAAKQSRLQDVDRADAKNRELRAQKEAQLQRYRHPDGPGATLSRMDNNMIFYGAPDPNERWLSDHGQPQARAQQAGGIMAPIEDYVDKQKRLQRESQFVNDQQGSNNYQQGSNNFS